MALHICESVFRNSSTKLIDNQNIATKMKKQIIINFSRLLCAVILSFGLVLTSCEDDLLGNGENTEQGENDNGESDGTANGGVGETNDAITNAFGGVTLTVMLRNLTEMSVVFYGEAVLAENHTASSFGILYSEEETFTAAKAQRLQIVDLYGTNYSVFTSSLKPSTTYYYTSYIKQGDLYKYGEIKSFTTASLVAPSLNDAADVIKTSAIISGIVSLAAGTASDLEYGFQYSITEDFSSGVISKKITDINSENKFSVPLASLVPATVYYYRSYIKMNGVYGYGEIKSFTTKGIIPVVPSGYTNLSAVTTANCYIISQSGSYCLLVAKGNQPSELLHLTNYASLLWESLGTSTIPSVGDLIKSVSYKDGYIAFQTADTFKEGNAVIAAKDADGTILWSWHIWLTEEPKAQVYYNNAGVFMDRDLGAKSSTPGDAGAFGLLYQWGRKDPFLSFASTTKVIHAKSTIEWPEAISSNSISEVKDWTIKHPTTFIQYDKDVDTTLWTGAGAMKSVYDPCPAGWRIPDGNPWMQASGGEISDSSRGDGWNLGGLLGTDVNIWYPHLIEIVVSASGFKQINWYGGYYWTSSMWRYEYSCNNCNFVSWWEGRLVPLPSLQRFTLGHSSEGCVHPYVTPTEFRPATGFPIRCIQE